MGDSTVKKTPKAEPVRQAGRNGRRMLTSLVIGLLVVCVAKWLSTDFSEWYEMPYDWATDQGTAYFIISTIGLVIGCAIMRKQVEKHERKW
jgi:hypothetical protein